MSKYCIIYDFCGEMEDVYGIEETYEGTWEELQEHIRWMESNGCYHFDVVDIGGEDFAW